MTAAELTRASPKLEAGLREVVSASELTEIMTGFRGLLARS